MITITPSVSLKDKTSFKIGGAARYYVLVRTKQDISEALDWAQRHSQPVFILGKGSNVLISDNGWQGLVIDMSLFSALAWNSTNTVTVQSGALLHTLAKESVKRGLGGMEELAGIPGSIGGGVIMNAGAFSQTISDSLCSVEGIYRSGSSWSLQREEMAFGYRWSSFKDKNVILLHATFSFHQAAIDQVQKTYNSILRRRKQKQPLEFPNCGSVFKRPPDAYAGALIEKSGMKGVRRGGAMVSQKHANFIVNFNHASADDVRELIVAIQKRVYEQDGIVLEPEVIFVGDFTLPLFTP